MVSMVEIKVELDDQSASDISPGDLDEALRVAHQKNRIDPLPPEEGLEKTGEAAGTE